MRRAWVFVLVLLGLAAASLHAPAMALPEPVAPAMSVHADCHAVHDPAPKPEQRSCCPDGCFGGCLLPGALMPAAVVAERIAVRAPAPRPAADRPREQAVDGLFHPPRAFA